MTIVKPFRLLGYVKKNPFIFLTYFFIFALGVYSRLFVCLKFGTIQYDEGAHSIGGIFVSRFFLNRLGDPAGYLADYPATVDSFWFYPPLYSLLAFIGYLLFGYTEFVARLTSLVFSVLLIHVTIRVAKEVEPDEKVALISGFFVGVSSIIVIVGSGAMLDVPLTALVMYAVLFWIRGMKSGEDKEFLKAGLVSGLAGLMKPIGVGILMFMIGFQVLMFLASKDKIIFSEDFWKGMICGFLIFSAWWGSALLLKATVGGWIGEAALNGVWYWFNLFGLFGGYVPPWYSPPWYKYEGWTYYADHLSLMMGTLPFIFSFIGVGYRLKTMKRNDLLLILFTLGIYVILSFVSDKNPRFIIPCLPILYVYSSVGVSVVYRNIVGNGLPTKRVTVNVIRKLMACSLIVVVLFGGFVPLLSAVGIGYTPGMSFGNYLPFRESLQIIRDDGSEGIIMPDSQETFFNVPTLTFYIASVDYEGKYGCHWPLSNPEEILTFKMGDKSVRFVLVYNLTSRISRFVLSHPESFILIGKAENVYGTIFVYKVVEYLG